MFPSFHYEGNFPTIKGKTSPIEIFCEAIVLILGAIPALSPPPPPPVFVEHCDQCLLWCEQIPLALNFELRKGEEDTSRDKHFQKANKMVLLQSYSSASSLAFCLWKLHETGTLSSVESQKGVIAVQS